MSGPCFACTMAASMLRVTERLVPPTSMVITPFAKSGQVPCATGSTMPPSAPTDGAAPSTVASDVVVPPSAPVSAGPGPDGESLSPASGPPDALPSIEPPLDEVVIGPGPPLEDPAPPPSLAPPDDPPGCPPPFCVFV